MKAYEGMEINLHTFLTTAVQKFGPILSLGRFTRGEKPKYAPNRWLGRLYVGEREISCP